MKSPSKMHFIMSPQAFYRKTRIMKGRRSNKTGGRRSDSRWGSAPDPGIFLGMAPVFDIEMRNIMCPQNWMGNCGLFQHIKPPTTSSIGGLSDSAVNFHRRPIMPEMGDIKIWTGARSFVWSQINARFIALSVPIQAKAQISENMNKPELLATSYFNENRRHHSNIITETTGS
jgi:hypothetical protein